MLEIIIILAALVLDQATKTWCSAALPLYGGSVPLIEGVLHLTYTKNRGAAFGIMQDQRVFFIIMTVLALAFLVALLLYKRKGHSLLFRIALSLFISGALGNFIDRLFLGYVRDFIDFRLINFAIFNAADSCITIGAVLILIEVLILEPRRRKKQQQDAKPLEETAAPNEAPIES